MKNKKLYIKSISTLLYSWGSDTPPEVIWGLNEQLDFLEKEYNITFSCRFEECWQGVGESPDDIILREMEEKL